MIDALLKRLIQAAIESFPIDKDKKQTILKKVIKREEED